MSHDAPGTHDAPEALSGYSQEGSKGTYELLALSHRALAGYGTRFYQEGTEGTRGVLKGRFWERRGTHRA